LPITVQHLSYLLQVIEIWVLKYPEEAFSDSTLDNLYSRNGGIIERKDSKKMGRKNTNKRRQKVLHCIEYSKQMCVEVKLHGLVPHISIFVSVMDLYVYSNDWSAYFAVLRFAADRGNIYT
jgi:hypothetical protein